MPTKPRTLGELRRAGYRPQTVREEVHAKLVRKLVAGEALFPGILRVNELPDLPERIQVGLFNLMEERDVQIKGYRIRLPLDILIFATANPEDYTNRGRIITPLKDRFGAQVRTHYPLRHRDELAIVEQERSRLPEAEARVVMPEYMAGVVAALEAGLVVPTGSTVPVTEYVKLRDAVKGLRAAVERLGGGGSPPETA